MGTTTKKDLIDRISDETELRRSDTKRVVQSFLDNVIIELSRGNRLEFRDFGVFELRDRKPRIAQNPKTLEQVPVPARTTVKFKVGRLMRMALEGEVDIAAGDASVGSRRRRDELGSIEGGEPMLPTVETVRRESPSLNGVREPDHQ
jgi:integration host factor subunit beta